MRALSIRQPYAELILRGHKRIEYRSRATKIIGERFYIYASRGGTKGRRHEGTEGIWSRDLAGGEPPPWIVELADAMKLFDPHELAALPAGVIVGSAVIARCIPLPALDIYQWHLADVQRIARPRKPKRQPQPVWFNPF
jgi:hypothetical protein